MRLWAALALVLAVAAGTRLAGLDLIEFKADEAQVASLALDAAQGLWPRTSIATSNGVDNPPLPVYVFALPGLFTRDPAWMAAVSGLLDVLAVGLTFTVGRRYFCGRAGLAAAAFYAAAAYPAIFARKLAGPYLEPFFMAVLLWCLLAAACSLKGGGWAWAGALLALGALVQIHLGALLLVPVVALLLALDLWRRGSWRPALPATLGLAVVLAAFAPYAVYEARGRPAFLGIVGGAAQGTPGWTLEPFQWVWIALTSPGYGDLTGPLAGLFRAESWPAGYITPLAGIAALGGLMVAARRWREWRYATLLVVALAPLALLIRHGPGLEIHYFAFTLPAAFLLAGIGFDALLSAAPRLRPLGFTALGIVLLTQTLNFRHFTDFLDQHALPDAYGLPLAYSSRLFGAVGPEGRVAVAARGRDQAEVARYFLRGREQVEVDADAGLLLPRDGGTYVAFSRGTVAAQALEAALAPSFTERLPGGRSQAAVYRLPAGALGAVAAGVGVKPEPRAEWRNGLRLVGVAAPHALPGQLAAAWEVAAPVAGSTVLFSQVLDGDGKQWFDLDVMPASAADLRPGDGLITLALAALPADAPRQEYWWWLGAYEEGGRRVSLLDGSTALRVARLKSGTAAAPPGGLTPADAVFGGAIRLKGWALSADALTLEWECLQRPDRDYTVFVHALDPGGQVAAQADAPPDRYPTSLWDPGEVIVDRHALAERAGARVEVGLYDAATGKRLALADGSDQVTLGAQAAAR